MGAYRSRDAYGNVVAQALPLSRGRWYIVDPYGDHHIMRQSGDLFTSETHGPFHVTGSESMGRIEFGQRVADAVGEAMGGGEWLDG